MSARERLVLAYKALLEKGLITAEKIPWSLREEVMG